MVQREPAASVCSCVCTSLSFALYLLFLPITISCLCMTMVLWAPVIQSVNSPLSYGQYISDLPNFRCHDFSFQTKITTQVLQLYRPGLFMNVLVLAALLYLFMALFLHVRQYMVTMSYANMKITDCWIMYVVITCMHEIVKFTFGNKFIK